MTTKPVCGFIGLGSQGAPIARRMIEGGYPVVLWARGEHSLEPFRDSGASFAASPEELATQARHVGVCVVGDDGVTDICQKLFATLTPGSRVVIHSTMLPETCIRLAEQAHGLGIHLVDAPVSGGQPAAEAGKLTVMLGCDGEAVAKVGPVLETFASLIVHLGGVGAGQTAKLINNSLLVANMGLLHSAVTAGVDNGLDRDEFIHLLGASSGRSFALDVYARNPDPGDFGRLEALLEKIDLLGEVLGRGHPTYALLREATSPLETG